jgi:hypothetical protein
MENVDDIYRRFSKRPNGGHGGQDNKYEASLVKETWFRPYSDAAAVARHCAAHPLNQLAN